METVNSELCERTTVLVEYIYGEADRETSEAVETHLMICNACTEEFAELSMSRLGVYEWHRDEFAPLETPRIVIPFDELQAKGLVAHVLQILSDAFTPPKLAFGSAAALLLCTVGFFTWYSAFQDMRTGEIASSSAETAMRQENEPNSTQTLQPPMSDIPMPSVVASDALQSRSQAVSAVRTSRKSVRKIPTLAVGAGLTAGKKRVTRMPLLEDLEDETDESLRLADLLADTEPEV